MTPTNKNEHESRFLVIDVAGSARERGRAHGEAIADRIRATIAFYLDDLFAGTRLSRQQIETRARLVQSIGEEYAPAIVEEILGIADGSGIALWELFALNARTEILNAKVDECSALYFADKAVLAQNWDWVEPLESLCVVIRHQHSDGFQRIAFCEPGMVAKIGMNSAGIGVCLNILFSPHDLSGLPVHMLIGGILNCHSFTAARELLQQCGRGKSSHLLVASPSAGAISAEFYSDQLHLLEPQEGVLLHTNHCLALGQAGRHSDLANSCARYDRLLARTHSNPERGIDAAKSILLSLEGGEDSIMRPYRPNSVLGNHPVGSCASIVMELERGLFHVKRGPSDIDDYETLAIQTLA